SINGTDNGYRSDGVDLEVTSDTGGGVDLGWTFGGDWFKYTVKVATAGTYTVSFRVAAPTSVTDAFHLANASGTNLSGSVNVPATGGYQTWTTVTANVTLPAGQQVLTLDQDNGGWNINYMGFAQQVPTFTITASAGSNGSISPSGTVTVNSGASQSFTITPSSGFVVSSVTVDGASQGAITTYKFSNVTANHTISATFASSGGLNPNVPPGQNFNLSNWELDLPTGSSGNINIITQPQLATYTDAYFYTDPNDGAMTFFCPENGVHTTNSSFPRSELRELNPGGDWPLTGTNIQTATLKVEDTLAHVAIGQIHIGNGGTPTSTKPLLELFYYSTGQITLLLETSPSGGGPETNVTTVPLGQKFSYTIKTVGNALTIIVNGVTQNYTINSSYNSERFYFKAGDYLQTTGSSSTVGAHVAFYALNVTHQ
ncbi:MAG TPA: polysaccharide lyase family 7 protein, partial [Opitutaceae bacterium]|nr:polysaccharide lyase family 7 protein [Opitutaceae bacterium]